MTGAMYGVKITVDGWFVGEVEDGSSLTIGLAAGYHEVKVSGGGMSRNADVIIKDGSTTCCQTYSSVWGIFGGGLNFKPA